MILTGSRYADGQVVSSYTNTDGAYHTSVFRTFPTDTASYSLYVWREPDRIDLIARQFLGDASKWWRIMDFNPEILNPMDIPVGTTIRIPNYGQ
jgi:nucleoid-associated protein YgaU